MKAFLVTILLVAIVGVAHAQEETCENANEKYNRCGNLCEDSCSNNCDASSFIGFGKLRPDKNPDCVPGCYCAQGYIRNDDNECVPNVSGVCGNNRCDAITKNAVYMRCVSSAPPSCFRRTVAYMTGGMSGRCVCEPGYSMNSKKKCVKTNSRACKAEKLKNVRLGHLPNAPDCE